MKTVFYSIAILLLSFSFQATIQAQNKSKSDSTTGVLLDTRDGRVYDIVKIGTQWWMAENLNAGVKVSPSVGQKQNVNIEKYCYGADVVCDNYGGLYLWDEVMFYTTTEGTQGICPSNWHIPSDDDWKELEMSLGMSQTEADNFAYRGTNEGGMVKSVGTTHWNAPNTGAINSVGFNLLPGGYFNNSDGSFYNTKDVAYLWTSTSHDDDYKWHRGFTKNDATIYRNVYLKVEAMSVRCVMNSLTTRASSIELNNSIKIYPNPAKDELVLSFKQSKSFVPVTATIVNPIGMVVKTITIPTNSKNLKSNISDIAPGIYFVKISSENNISITKRLLIQRDE